MASARKSLGHAAPARRWAIHLTVESKKLGIPSAWIKKTVKAVLEHAERDIRIPEVHEIHVVITDDKRIKVINREFRKKDKATDVLSFPQFTPREISGRTKALLPGPYLGDLVIAAETTLRQAESFGVTPREELLRLIVHGILHLCGYDHEKVPAAVAQRMRRRERYIRGKIGL